MGLLKWLFGDSGTSVTASEAQSQLKSYYVLDVRQPNEFQSGHIDGAKLIPLNQLSQKINTLPKDREILCVCRSGSRSGSATRQLTKAGLTAVNMRGGMMAWQRAGFPVKKGSR